MLEGISDEGYIKVAADTDVYPSVAAYITVVTIAAISAPPCEDWEGRMRYLYPIVPLVSSS